MTILTRRLARLFFVVPLLACPPAFAQPEPPQVSQRAPASAEIHGKIAISRDGEIHGEQSHAPLFDRYAAHGGGNAMHAVNAAETTLTRLSERAVVYLEGEELNHGSYALPPKSPMLDQKGLQFHPQVLPVLVGTTVDFPNRDNLFHNVFSYSQTKEFDLGRYPQNDSRSVTFDRVGTVRVYCDIHSQMNATILVLPHPYFATPDDDGAYVIPDVPEGRYKIVLWYGRDVLERRAVTIKAGESMEVNFSH